MKAKASFLALIAMAASSVQAATPDELCSRLKAFESDRPQSTAPVSQRRWFEFHWGFDPASIWSWGCLHSEDQLATSTCRWLMDHTNQEFSMMLPQRIMACYGYRFPKYAYYDWGDIAGTITLRGAGGQRLLMDLNYRDLPGGEQALRVSAKDVDRRYDPEELPSIKPMPSEQGKVPAK